MVTLDGGRISIGAMAVGIAQASLDAALKYAKEREQFGRPIAQFQAIQFKLADMAMEVELARTLVLKAAWLKDQGRPFTREGAMAKLFASEAATRAANQAIQIHGGAGYMEDFPVSRYWRDAKLTEIGEGTSEVQRIVIAKQLGC
jgi:alkylation response protein AidB-like acyl-CoA dehydrogenase